MTEISVTVAALRSLADLVEKEGYKLHKTTDISVVNDESNDETSYTITVVFEQEILNAQA